MSQQPKLIQSPWIERLLGLALVLLGLSFWGAPPQDPDLGWHLMGGLIILREGAPPLADPINTFNSVWVDYHWLAQLWLANIYLHFGLVGLQVWLGLMMALIAFILWSSVRRYFPRSPVCAFLAAGLLLGILGEVTSIRPHVISLLLLLCAQYLLLKRRHSFSELPLLFGLTVVLTNVHVYWIFVPILFIAHRGSRYALERAGHCNASYLWGGFLSLLLAGLISPYGLLGPAAELPYGYLTPYGLLYDYALQTPELKNYIAEFRSALELNSAVRWLVILLPALALPLLIRKSRILAHAGPIALGIMAFVLSVRTLKFLALLTVCGLPAICLSLRQFRRLAPMHRLQAQLSPLRGAFVTIALLYGLFQAVRYSPWCFNSQPFMQMLPEKACRSIAHLSDRPSEGREHLRLATFFDTGGWCRFFIYDENPEFKLKVTTDGRTQFINPQEYIASFDVFRVNYAWIRTLKRWDPDLVLAEKGRALGEVLTLASNDWEMIHDDAKFRVFRARRLKGNQAQTGSVD